MNPLTPEQIFPNVVKFLGKLNYSDEAKAIAIAINSLLEIDCEEVNEVLKETESYISSIYENKINKLETKHTIKLRTITTKRNIVIDKVALNIPQEWELIRLKVNYYIKLLRKAYPDKNPYAIVGDEIGFTAETTRKYLSRKYSPGKNAFYAIKLLFDKLNQMENGKEENN